MIIWVIYEYHLNMKFWFTGHVWGMPGGGAGAGWVQRPGESRSHCRHSYQCIHRYVHRSKYHNSLYIFWLHLNQCHHGPIGQNGIFQTWSKCFLMLPFPKPGVVTRSIRRIVSQHWHCSTSSLRTLPPVVYINFPWRMWALRGGEQNRPIKSDVWTHSQSS